jgi:predicted esterase
MVTGVRKGLEKNPNIDFNQVYVFAASKETHYLSECVAKSPGLWKGIILLDPGELPDFSKSPPLQQRPKILISAGGEEHEEDRLKNYQEEALKSGVIVETVISPSEAHFFVGNAGQLDRAKGMARFIFDE